MGPEVVADTAVSQALFLDLIKKCLTRDLFAIDYQPVGPGKGMFGWLRSALMRKLLVPRKAQLFQQVPVNHHLRAEGRDWPFEGETMIGLRRLDNLQFCITDVLRRSVPGDLIETGVWRGGATIFMRAVLKAFGDTNRIVWVADSFQGLPKPNPERYPADLGVDLWRCSQLAVSLEEVKANFVRFGLLDQQVRFLVGWFRDTLPTAPIERLAVLRLDGDLYESTMDALQYLYPKLSLGGYLIVDDYGCVAGCKAAVADFRVAHGIIEEIVPIDWSGVFWKRLR
jgi:O-methyltransferase